MQFVVVGSVVSDGCKHYNMPQRQPSWVGALLRYWNCSIPCMRSTQANAPSSTCRPFSNLLRLHSNKQCKNSSPECKIMAFLWRITKMMSPGKQLTGICEERKNENVEERRRASVISSRTFSWSLYIIVVLVCNLYSEAVFVNPLSCSVRSRILWKNCAIVCPVWLCLSNLMEISVCLELRADQASSWTFE